MNSRKTHVPLWNHTDSELYFKGGRIYEIR